MIYIGIDPGKSGAISFLNENEPKIKIYDMPLKENGDIDSNEILQILTYETTGKLHAFCALEKAQSMRRKGVVQGTVSSFTYGIGYGKILAILDLSLKNKYKEVHPMSWKKEFSLTSKKGEKLTGKDRKKLSEKKALELFPDQKRNFYTKRGKLLDGRVEALLLAKYAEIEYKRKTRAIRIKRNQRPAERSDRL